MSNQNTKLKYRPLEGKRVLHIDIPNTGLVVVKARPEEHSTHGWAFVMFLSNGVTVRCTTPHVWVDCVGALFAAIAGQCAFYGVESVEPTQADSEAFFHLVHTHLVDMGINPEGEEEL